MLCNDQMRFFVVGSPRSGTTLLQAMLNRHPDIVVPPETKVYCDFDGCSRTQQARCLDRLRSDFSLPKEWCFPPNAEQLLVSLQSQFLKTVGRANAKWVGEKTPEHTSRLLRIREDFPEAPIIAVVRNGFDVAASLTRVPWIRCGYGSGAIIWNYYMNHVCRSFKSKPNHFLIVTYEELCRDPISVLNQIFSLLNVDSNFAESCLSPDAEKDRFLFPARELKWKSRALQPLQPFLADDRHLSLRLQIQIRVACEPMLKQWGYIRDIQPCLHRIRSWFRRRAFCMDSQRLHGCDMGCCRNAAGESVRKCAREFGSTWDISDRMESSLPRLVWIHRDCPSGPDGDPDFTPRLGYSRISPAPRG